MLRLLFFLFFCVQAYAMSSEAYPEMSLFPIELRIYFHKQNIAQLKSSISRLKESIARLKGEPIVYRCSTPVLVEVSYEYLRDWSSSYSDSDDEDMSMGLFD